jgi:GxxExxY protein
MSTEPLQQEGYDFMAAAFEVYNEMGHGYTEDIYQESLEAELKDRKIGFLAQVELPIQYKGKPLRRKLRPDLILFNDMIVELKAATALTSEHESQLLNYPKATGKPVGYLVNFGSREKLEWKRFVRTHKIRVH